MRFKVVRSEQYLLGWVKSLQMVLELILGLNVGVYSVWPRRGCLCHAPNPAWAKIGGAVQKLDSFT